MQRLSLQTGLLTLILLTAGGLAGAGEARPDGCVGDAAEVVCVPVVETKTKTRTCYSCRTTIVCLPFKPRCDGCGDCGRPRQVRVLIKRFVKEESLQRACEPVVPVCLPEKKP